MVSPIRKDAASKANGSGLYTADVPLRKKTYAAPVPLDQASCPLDFRG